MSAVINHYKQGLIKRLEFSCTAKSSDGSFEDTELPTIDGTILQIRTKPGTPAPAANYDVKLLDSVSIDRLQGAGMNRHTSDAELAQVVFSGSDNSPVVCPDEVLSLNITGSTVNSAETQVDLYYFEGI